MFKKIEIWILWLVILAGILFTIGFGTLVRQELIGRDRAGWVGWATNTALFLAELPINVIKMVSSPLTVEDRFPELAGFNGIPNASQSFLLLTRYDGDIDESVVELVDLSNFQRLHTWNPDIDAFNEAVKDLPDFKYITRDTTNKRGAIGHALLTKDGGLLFQGRSPLRKIDACSNLIFQNAHDQFHHSIETDIDDNIWVPSLMYPQVVASYKVGRGLTEEGGFGDDGIVKLSPEGKILFEKSVSQIFIDNDLEHRLFAIGDSFSSGKGDFNSDPIHLNDIQPVNFDGKFWKKGDVFLSLRHQSMILLYRPSTNEIVWKLTGQFFHPHDVDILDAHRISFFNNNSKDLYNGDWVDGHNEVLVYDFNTNTTISYLKDSLEKYDVRTITGGRSEILPNGDLFIEETNFARLLYFNADGSLRWLYVNRAENGGVYQTHWPRLMYNAGDLNNVKTFLKNRPHCND
jgi:hypothetical protein